MVQINLTQAQLKKALKGLAIQIPHHQLVNNSGEHVVDLDLDKKTVNKINRSMINGKGFRLPKGIMDAGMNFAKTKGLDLAKKGATMAANYAIAEGSKRLSKALQGNNSVEGEGFLDVMKKVGKKIAPIAKVGVKALLPTVATMAGNYVGGPQAGLIAGQMAQKGVSGMGVGKLKKGSEEMKEHMARIRGMRKSKGDGIFDVVKSAAKAAAPGLIKAGSKMATDALIKKVQGQGIFDMVKTAAKAAAPGLIKAGSKMATDALIKKVQGQGIYKKVRHHTIDTISSSGKKSGRVRNPRMKPENRILINGIDQVQSGGSFAGFQYA